MVAGGEEKMVAFRVTDLGTFLRVSLERHLALMEKELLKRQEQELCELAHSMPLENGEAGRHG